MGIPSFDKYNTLDLPKLELKDPENLEDLFRQYAIDDLRDQMNSLRDAIMTQQNSHNNLYQVQAALYGQYNSIQQSQAAQQQSLQQQASIGSIITYKGKKPTFIIP